jgi:triphosphoribosyl-dephospho-CoA synthase
MLSRLPAGRDRHATLAALAHRSLIDELRTHPKPGLVSHRDCGSHADMDEATFRASAAALRPYFHRLANAGAAAASMADLRAIGLQAEAAMNRATAGVNTHRGAIFGLGLLCAAAARAPLEPLGAAVARFWGHAIINGPTSAQSHGADALRRHGAGGARAEAAAGFPTLHRVGLPTLAAARSTAPGDPEAARVQTLFALIAHTEDTNLLHRGGRAGAEWAKAAAAAFIAEGGIARPGWRDEAEAIHRAFIARNLSPGGCADLLAMTLFVDAVDREPAA